MASQDMSSVASDALVDFFTQLFEGAYTLVYRLYNNTYESFAQVSLRRWTRVCIGVAIYVILRPYIERLFKHLHEKDRKKEMDKQRADREEFIAKEARMNANMLRPGGGNASEGGKVLGEVENTDDEIEEGDSATATGVSDLSKNARKRQKKMKKNLEREAERRTDNMTEEQILELLDWSESEDEKK